MGFTATFCEPLKKDIVVLGAIPKDSILQRFEKTNWDEYLLQIERAKQEEVYYSPSLEFINEENKHSVVISAVGVPYSYEFYVFYKRPKMVKKLLGIGEKTNNDYVTSIEGQSKQDVINCLNAFVNNDTTYLAEKIGK